MDLVVKNGTIVTASCVSAADIGIVDGKIAQIGGNLEDAAKIVDATGCYVMPGGIDVHTHLDFSQFQYCFSGRFSGGHCRRSLWWHDDDCRFLHAIPRAEPRRGNRRLGR